VPKADILSILDFGFLLIQGCPHGFRQIGLLVGLAKQGDPNVIKSILVGDLVRVTRGHQYLVVLVMTSQFVGEIISAHARRHDHVAKYQINALTVFLQDFQRRRTVVPLPLLLSMVT